jgi:hypothetical protein
MESKRSALASGPEGLVGAIDSHFETLVEMRRTVVVQTGSRGLRAICLPIGLMLVMVGCSDDGRSGSSAAIGLPQAADATLKGSGFEVAITGVYDRPVVVEYAAPDTYSIRGEGVSVDVVNGTQLSSAPGGGAFALPSPNPVQPLFLEALEAVLGRPSPNLSEVHGTVQDGHIDTITAKFGGRPATFTYSKVGVVPSITAPASVVPALPNGQGSSCPSPAPCRVN